MMMMNNTNNIIINNNNNNNNIVSSLSDDASSGGSGGGGVGGGGAGGGGNGGGGGVGLKKGPWTAAEDSILMEYVKKHGEGNWNAVQKNSGLSRCGKSCRLRWANHLRPNLKKGSFSPEEERLILELHSKLGNKWARMAAQLPGRTDNEIKNYWNTRVKRRQRAGLPLYPNDIQKQAASSFHLHHQHHHHQQHQQQPSSLSQALQAPTQFSSFSSCQGQKSNYSTSPLPLFDHGMNMSSPTQFSTQQNNAHFLSTPINGFKRFRGNNFGFSSHQQFSSSPTQTLPPPSSSSLFNHNLGSQMLPPPSIQFNPGSYDLNPSTMLLQTHYEPNNHNTSPLSSAFSIKLEPPSIQLSQPAANADASGTTDTDDFKMSTSLNRSNSGLLDAMLQEAQAMGGGGEMRREGVVSEQEDKCKLDDELREEAPPLFSETTTNTPPLASSNQWDDSSPANSSIGGKNKDSTGHNEINSMEDVDLSSLLDIIPSTMMVSEYYNDGGEISNGQSSGVTDEDIGLDMQQLPSSLSINTNTITNTPTTTTTNTNTNTTTMEHDWNIGAWSNIPEMC